MLGYKTISKLSLAFVINSNLLDSLKGNKGNNKFTIVSLQDYINKCSL